MGLKFVDHPIVQVGGVYYGYITNVWVIFTWATITFFSGTGVSVSIYGGYELFVIIWEAIFKDEIDADRKKNPSLYS